VRKRAGQPRCHCYHGEPIGPDTHHKGRARLAKSTVLSPYSMTCAPGLPNTNASRSARRRSTSEDVALIRGPSRPSAASRPSLSVAGCLRPHAPGKYFPDFKRRARPSRAALPQRIIYHRRFRLVRVLLVRRQSARRPTHTLDFTYRRQGYESDATSKRSGPDDRNGIPATTAG